jgi:hypothetical protein
VYYDTTSTNWDDHSAQITTLEESDQPAELTVWKTLLFVFAYLCMTAKTEQDKLIHCWVRALLEWYPLPTVETLEEFESFEEFEPALDDQMMNEFIPDSKQPIHDLNNTKPRADFPFLSEDASERLGDRVAQWASDVVEKSAFQLSDTDRIMMYMSPSANDAKWAYGDVTGAGKESDGVNTDVS